MAELIVRVVVNVLGHVPIQNRKGIRVKRIPSRCLCELVILSSPEFPILLPQVALQNFSGG